MSDEMYGGGPRYSVNLEHVRWGRFSVMPEGTSEATADLSEVVFVQTAVNLSEPEHIALVEQLAPVRETVSPELLSFESLIQRDLDDARVSNALIPYLLNGAPGQVRMFPSILVLLLPMKDDVVQSKYLQRRELPPESAGPHVRSSIAYSDGDRRHAFEFSRLRTTGGSYLPYGAHLRVNPQFSSFAIIDGQHRAMAVLALWRNKTKWPERAKAFRDFYANHTKDLIEKTDFSGLSLPVTICFFPRLYEGNPSPDAQHTSVIKAARKLFLDVNRNAKTPSKARQVLLDDQRVTSDFVRTVMSRIKDNPKGDDGLRLCNLYYDQMEDNESHLPKLAVTSVLHIQYAIRALLLGKKQHKNERLITRCDFAKFNPGDQDNNRTLVDMLGWEALFGSGAQSWKDETIPHHHREAAIAAFMKTWGSVIDRFLEGFPAFRAIAFASNITRQNLEQSAVDEDAIVKRMLFEGQGLRAVHDAIREELDTKAEDRDGPAYPDSTQAAFRRQGKRLVDREEQTMVLAAERFWGAGELWPNWLPEGDRKKLVAEFTALCSTLFKTKAFQVGFVMSVGHLERKLSETDRVLFWAADVPALLLQRVFRFFSLPGGFPGANLGAERKAVWAQDVITGGRFAGLHGDGFYRHVRDVLNVVMQDGHWQIPKYWFMEIAAAKGLKDVAAANEEWLTAAESRGFSREEVDGLVDRIHEFAIDAVWAYRDNLLNADFERECDTWRKDNNAPPTAEVEAEVWSRVRDRLATRLEGTFKVSRQEAKEVRNRLRGRAPAPALSEDDRDADA
jgi:hypothetical protein